MRIVFADLIRRADRKADGYSRLLQAARVRAAHQRSYFAPALFNLIPVETTLIGSMAVDAHWRLYYNDGWLTAHSVEENATLLIHEVSHLLRDHDARRRAAGFNDHRRWNTAGDCEINDDLHAEGLPLPGNPPLPDAFGLPNGSNAESYYAALPAPPKSHRRDPSDDVRQPWQDCGSGAHGQRRFWELPPDSETDGGVPSVDRMKAELVQREVARCIDEMSRYGGGVPLAWRRWARATLAPKIDYMATLRHAVRRALRDSTVGRYDRTYRRPHRRQACYGEFIMPSFHQPRPRPGFLIDTSSSMGESQMARAVSELGALTRQLGRARRQESVHGRADTTVRRRRHRSARRPAGVRREDAPGDRRPVRRQRLPHAVAGRSAAVSRRHDPRRRRHAGPVGRSGRKQSHHDRRPGRRRSRQRDAAGEMRWPVGNCRI